MTSPHKCISSEVCLAKEPGEKYFCGCRIFFATKRGYWRVAHY